MQYIFFEFKDGIVILLTKQEYMQRLYTALKPLSKENRNKVMNDYELQFSQEMKNGKTEQDIIYDLGSPEDAAEYFINMYQSDRGYHDHYNIEQAGNKNSGTAHSWEAAIWGTLSIIIVPTMIAIMLAPPAKVPMLLPIDEKKKIRRMRRILFL